MAPEAAKQLTVLLRDLRAAGRDFDVDSLLAVVRYLETETAPAVLALEPDPPSRAMTCTAEGIFRVHYTFPNGHWYTITFGMPAQTSEGAA